MNQILLLSALEGYVLYRVWTSQPGQKDWPWYVLGAVVGINILGKIGLGAMTKDVMTIQQS